MVDPTSDLEADVDEDEAPTCHTCGDPIANEPTHRVVTWIESGTVETRHFCEDACLDAADLDGTTADDGDAAAASRDDEAGDG